MRMTPFVRNWCVVATDKIFSISYSTSEETFRISNWMSASDKFLIAFTTIHSRPLFQLFLSNAFSFEFDNFIIFSPLAVSSTSDCQTNHFRIFGNFPTEWMTWRNSQSMSARIRFNFFPSKNSESLLFIVTNGSAVHNTHKNTFQTIAMKQRTVVTGRRHSNRMLRKDDGRCDQFPCLNMHSDCVDICFARFHLSLFVSRGNAI